MPRTPAAPSSRSGAWASVQCMALSKVLVMEVAGVFELINLLHTKIRFQHHLLLLYPILLLLLTKHL